MRKLNALVGMLVVTAVAYSAAAELLFSDDFNTSASYLPEITRNPRPGASPGSGHLPRNFLYTWTLSPTGETQAFYIVYNGALIQCGRAGSTSQFVVANKPLPADATEYTVEYRLKKTDDDPVFTVFGTDNRGKGGVRITWKNEGRDASGQYNDKAVSDLEYSGALGNGIVKGAAYPGRFALHRFTINTARKTIEWTVEGAPAAKGTVSTLPRGGYTGVGTSWAYRMDWDDFKITVISRDQTMVVPQKQPARKARASDISRLSVDGRSLAPVQEKRRSKVSRAVIHP